MDKYEYKLRSEEIKSLIAERDFVKAVEIADTIDWSRVRSVSMLCTISDLYKVNRRYKEAKEILTQAYERYPNGRTILYSLCELCIKTDDIVQAIEYYKAFVQQAPTDNGKFVLQYKIYEAQDVSLEERIAVLEELKKRDYREKWGYELAYLYHRIGLTTKCVEECDELILWFREGRYVKKAMELKMLHQPLTEQQEIWYKQMLPDSEKQQYEDQTKVYDGREVAEALKKEETAESQNPEEMDIKVKTVDVGKYNTINLQKELAKSMKEVLVADNSFEPLYQEEGEEETESQPKEPVPVEAEKKPAAAENSERMVEVTTGQNPEPGSVTEAIMEPMLRDMELYDEEEESGHTESEMKKPLTIDGTAVSNADGQEENETETKEDLSAVSVDMTQVDPPEKLGRLLSQEYNGQISMVVPDEEKVEKQITGQLNLEDIMKEWEKTKKENEEEQKQKTIERVFAQTGTLFTEFEAKVRDGILEKLEKGEVDLDSIKDENSSVIADEVKEVLHHEDSTENTSGSEEDEVEELEELEEEPPEETDEDAQEETAEEFREESGEQQQEGTAGESQEEPEGKPCEEPVKEDAEEKLDEEIKEKLAAEENKEEQEREPADDENAGAERNMSEEEIELFAPFVQTKSARIRLMKALDMISLSSYTGNVFVTGETQEEAAELAKNVIREVQITDHNFSGKVAKVTGCSLNNRDIESMIDRLNNGGLIVEKASGMDVQTVKDLLKALNQENKGIVVVLQDNKKARNRMMEDYTDLKTIFNVHIEVEELSDEALVAYGRKYARHLEYSIDEMGILALHTRIDCMQTADHIVTVADVRDIIDEAIERANHKSLKHFTEVLFAKRYDDDDMIILREKDFL